MEPSIDCGPVEGALLVAMDWSATPLGPVGEWPQRLRSAVDLILPSDVAMLILWGSEFRQIHNAAYRRLMGGNQVDLLGLPYLECGPWLISGDILTRVIAGETVTVEDVHHPLLRTDGVEDAWFTITTSPIRDKDGMVAGVLAVVIETSADKRTAIALRKSEARFRALLRASSDAVYRINPDWSEMHAHNAPGFPDNAAGTGSNWLDTHIPAEDRTEVRAAIRQAVETGTTFALKHRIRCANGTIGRAASKAVPILDDRGEIREWFGTTRTITVPLDDTGYESETRFRALVTACTQVLYRHSPDWSELLQLTGGGLLAETDAPDPDWLDVYIPPEDQDRVRAAIQEAICNKHIFELEHRVKLADGGIGWIMSRSVPLFDERGEIVEWFGAASDITAAHRAAEALSATAGRYRTLFDSIDQGFCTIEMIFDEAGRPVDYVFLEVNPAFVAHTGLPDPVGRRMREMIPNHEQYWFDIYGRIALTGKAERFEQRTAVLDRWLDLYAFRIGAPGEHRIAVLFNDISERKCAEEALRESEERLRHIIESATEYAIITLSTAGSIESWNSGAERLLGYKGAEVLGQPFAILHTDEDAAVGEPERKLKLAAREGRAESRHWVVCKDGSRFWGSGVILPMEGDEKHFIKIFRDRTEERAAEERQALLTGELNHRVKNTLSVVQAIASQTFRHRDVDGNVLNDFSGRLQALAVGHDILVRNGWHSADLFEVACKVLAPFLGRDERMQIAGPKIPLSPSSALSITMVLHELATNAVKYGALANRTGRVDISWTTTGPAGDEDLRFRWEESGGPAVEQPKREGFGSMLIAHSLSREIGAGACLDYAPTGLVCTITARASDLSG